MSIMKRLYTDRVLKCPEESNVFLELMAQFRAPAESDPPARRQFRLSNDGWIGLRVVPVEATPKPTRARQGFFFED